MKWFRSYNSLLDDVRLIVLIGEGVDWTERQILATTGWRKRRILHGLSRLVDSGHISRQWNDGTLLYNLIDINAPGAT